MAIALIVFVVSYIFIATERFPRQAVALLGAVALILLNVFPIQEAVNFVDWETMGLLFGMFILVIVLGEVGFFTWFANQVVVRLHYRPTYIFIVLPLLAGFMSAFMGSITVMLLLAPLSFRIARLIGVDPVPLVAAEVCAANTGGAATLIGNPPNVILGTMLGFGFNDFVIHTAPIAVLVTLVLVMAFYLLNRDMLIAAERQIDAAKLAERDTGSLISNPHILKLGLVCSALALVLLMLPKSPFLGLNISFSPATAALLPALILVVAGGDETRYALRKIDYESLLFFVGLFVLVGALQKTQLIAILAGGLFELARGSQVLLLSLLYWGSGFASAVVDNVPMALAMAYIARDMPDLTGTLLLRLVVWTLALGIGMGGNMTPVGASPNVLAYSYLEQSHGKIGWPCWMKMTVPPTMAAMLVAAGILYLKYITGWY